MEQIAFLAPFFCSLPCLMQSLRRVHKDSFRNAALMPVIISTWGRGLSVYHFGRVGVLILKRSAKQTAYMFLIFLNVIMVACASLLSLRILKSALLARFCSY